MDQKSHTADAPAATPKKALTQSETRLKFLERAKAARAAGSPATLYEAAAWMSNTHRHVLNMIESGLLKPVLTPSGQKRIPWDQIEAR